MIVDIILIVAGALFVGVYVSWRAGRIDRLHARVDMARAALDATLLRRSSVAQELAGSGLLDPATSLLLAGAVHGTRSSDRPRDLAESDLTRALRAAFSQPDFRASLGGKEGADELLAGVEEAAHQVFVARKFYNDLAAATRARAAPAAGPRPAPVRPGPGPGVLRDGRLPGRREGRHRAGRLTARNGRATAGSLRRPYHGHSNHQQASEVPSCPLSTLTRSLPPAWPRAPRGSSAAWRRCSRAA